MESYTLIDWQNPVNKNHGLNQGLKLWLLSVAGFNVGGTKIRNLVSNHHEGALGSAGWPTWGNISDIRRGAFGPPLTWRGGGGPTKKLAIPTLAATSRLTVSFWYWWDGSSSSVDTLFEWTTSSPRITMNDTFNTIEIVGGTPSGVIPTNEWAQGIITLDDAANLERIYINGVLDTAASFSGTCAGTSLEIGSFIGGLINYDDLLDDIRVYDRILSATEASELYLLSKASQQDLLNREDLNAWKVPAAEAITTEFLPQYPDQVFEKIEPISYGDVPTGT